MEELIAKRYVKAIKEATDIESLENVTHIFTVLAASFKDEKFKSVVSNPNVNAEDKKAILLDAVNAADSQHVNNLIKLLVENGRVDIIPAIAEVMRKDLAYTTKRYIGTVYSNSDIDEKVMQDLSAGLGKKLNSDVSLNFVKDDFDGIKVNVDDLGVEINFSKSRINSQMIEHIVKAI